MARPTLAGSRPKLNKPTDSLYFQQRDDTNPEHDIPVIPTGCTLLDLVVGGGYPIGRITNIVGDKSTGKTLLAIEAIANFRRAYPKGTVRYNETEAAFDPDYAASIGVRMTEEEMTTCDTVEQLYDDLSKFCARSGRERGLYIVDSLDAISDAAEMDRGIGESTYGATKPKQLGQLFRRLTRPLADSGTHLMIISQVRDNIGVSFGEKHTRSGGRALDFYASQILWLAHMGQLKKTIKGVERAIGVKIKAKTKKNKIAPPFRECEFNILFGYGIDDDAASINFLNQCKVAVPKTNLIGKVRETWHEIEDRFKPERGKYV